MHSWGYIGLCLIEHIIVGCASDCHLSGDCTETVIMLHPPGMQAQTESLDCRNKIILALIPTNLIQVLDQQIPFEV